MNSISKFSVAALILLLFGCTKTNQNPTIVPPPVDLEHTYGFNVLNKLKGIWSGPVTSTTLIGSFPLWVVDFRPISENQISAKNELDTANDIFMSFFIAKYNNEYRVAFRNGGSFSTLKRVSYLLADSVVETPTASYYRFSEIIKGKNKAYTTVIFRADSLYISAYTNKYNTQATAVLHMAWSAKKQDTSSCMPAMTLFSFPKKTLTQDFSTAFTGQPESIFYGTTTTPPIDPYPESAQPFLGKTSASYSFASGLNPVNSHKVFLVICAQPLFGGPFFFNMANLKYMSRYVIMDAGSTHFLFTYMHPGTYYYYALYDRDGNNTINSGDWISSSNIPFTLSPTGLANITTQIDFTIP